MAGLLRKVADLRFTSPDDESHFRDHIAEGLCQYLVVFGVAASLIMVVRTAATLGMVGELSVLRDLGPATIFVLYFIVSIALTATVGFLALVHTRCKPLRLFDPELALCLLAFVVLVPAPLPNESHVAQLFGKQPAVVWGQDMAGCDLMSGFRNISAVFVLTLGSNCRFHVLSPVILMGWIAFVASSSYFDADIPRYSQLLPVVVSAMYALALFLARKKELLLREMWQAQSCLRMQHMELSKRHKSTAALLQRFCDSAVTLSLDLRLKAHSSRLAALLLKQGGATLEGTNFCDFLASAEDRERFAAAMHRVPYGSEANLEPDVPEAANVVLVSLKDAHGTVFTVHIHHVCIATSKCTEHLIGIVESEASGVRTGGDGEQQDQMGELMQFAGVPPGQRLGIGAAAGDDADAANSTGGSASLSSGTQSSSSLQENVLQVDFFMAPGMRVTFQSNLFTETFGEIEAGADLCTVLEDPDAFRAWLEEKKASLLSGSLRLPAGSDFGVVKVQGPKSTVAQELFLTMGFPAVSPNASVDIIGLVHAGRYRVSARFEELTSRRVRRWKRRQRLAQLPAILRGADAQGTEGALAALRGSRLGQRSSVIPL